VFLSDFSYKMGVFDRKRVFLMGKWVFLIGKGCF
jgi:hypothetical protein